MCVDLHRNLIRGLPCKEFLDCGQYSVHLYTDAGFSRFKVIPLAGPTSAAVVYK